MATTGFAGGFERKDIVQFVAKNNFCDLMDLGGEGTQPNFLRIDDELRISLLPLMGYLRVRFGGRMTPRPRGKEAGLSSFSCHRTRSVALSQRGIFSPPSQH